MKSTPRAGRGQQPPSAQAARLNTSPSGPPASQGFVQRHEVGDYGGVALGQVVLDGELLALGVQNCKEIGQAAGVEFVGQLGGFPAGSSRCLEMFPPLLLAAIGGNKVPVVASDDAPPLSWFVRNALRG